MSSVSRPTSYSLPDPDTCTNSRADHLLQAFAHVGHRLLHAPLPLAAEPFGVFRLLVGVEDAPARRDQGAVHAVLERGAGHVGGGALGAVAGQEEDGLG